LAAAAATTTPATPAAGAIHSASTVTSNIYIVKHSSSSCHFLF
jgi:hypothetical protein